MGQAEVIAVLLASDKPLNRGQIAELCGDHPTKISHLLNRLLMYQDIECIEVDRNKAAFLLDSKSPLRRMRFYYIGQEKKRFLI